MTRHNVTPRGDIQLRRRKLELKDCGMKTKKPKDGSPVEIWLAPDCEHHAGDEGRLWCSDNVWLGGCDECGMEPTRYIRPGLFGKRK
jgi:hypothetical protein